MQLQQLNRGNRRVLADRSIGARLICRPAQRCRASVAARSADKFDAQVAVVLGTQWGDEGKGKLVDILAQQYDIVARAQVRRGSAGRALHAAQPTHSHRFCNQQPAGRPFPA